MGVRNRERRAARKRSGRSAGGARRGSGAAPGSGGFGGLSGNAGPDPADRPVGDQARADRVRAELLAAADGSVDGPPPRTLAARLLSLAPDPAQAGRLAAVLAEDAVRMAWRLGWQPADLAAVARRRLPAGAADAVVALVAELTARSPAARVDPRWTAQLAGLTVTAQWAERMAAPQGWASHPDGLADLLAVTGLVRALPELPSDVPLPGTASARSAPAEAVDPRALGRIRALLAKAESTTFPDEAEALSAKAQELMSRLSIDRLVVEASARSGSGPALVSVRRIWLDAPYVLAKAQLVDAVARANRCRLVIAGALGFVAVFGDAADLATVELLATSLLVQANRSMLAHGSQVDAWGRSRSRSFRQSFLVSYAVRIGERLTRTAERVVAEHAGAAELLPALRSAEQRVTEEVGRAYPRLAERGVNVTDHGGWAAGRAAADTARFDGAGELAG